MFTKLTSVREIPSYAVIIRAIHERGATQQEALTELTRRGLWLTAEQKIEAGLAPVYYACEICGHSHPWKWDGDCRDDAHRFTDEALDARHGPDGYELRTMTERVLADGGSNDC